MVAPTGAALRGGAGRPAVCALVGNSRPLRLHVGGGLTYSRPAGRPAQRWYSRRLAAWVAAPPSSTSAGPLQQAAGRVGVPAACRAQPKRRRSHAGSEAGWQSLSSVASGGRGWGSLGRPGYRSSTRRLAARAAADSRWSRSPPSSRTRSSGIPSPRPGAPSPRGSAATAAAAGASPGPPSVDPKQAAFAERLIAGDYAPGLLLAYTALSAAQVRTIQPVSTW